LDRAKRARRAAWRGAGYELAEAIESLIAAGHPPAAVWQYTPRQMQAFLFIAARRRQREHRELLALHAMAARGEGKDIKKALRDDG